MPEAISPIGQLPLLKRTTQNVVLYSYETKLGGLLRLLTIAWVKTLNGHSLHVGVDDPSYQYACKVKLNSWKSFWNKQGVKSFEVGGTTPTATATATAPARSSSTTSRVDIYWDFSCVKCAPNGPEPQGGFFVAVVCNDEMVLLLGDKTKEAYKRTRARAPPSDAALLSRIEHIFGKKVFCTKGGLDRARDKAYDIVIEYETEEQLNNGGGDEGPGLSIKIEEEQVIHVRNLEWKFRGNHAAVVGGAVVEVFWDVHDWLFRRRAVSKASGPGGDAIFIFIFQARDDAAADAADKSKNRFDRAASATELCGGLDGSISLMKVPNARSLRTSRELLSGLGSSLMIHAWMTE